MSDGGRKRTGGVVQVDTEANEISAKRMVRQSGNSMVVSIPPTLLSIAGIDEGEEMTVSSQTGGGVEIERVDEDA